MEEQKAKSKKLKEGAKGKGAEAKKTSKPGVAAGKRSVSKAKPPRVSRAKRIPAAEPAAGIGDEVKQARAIGRYLKISPTKVRGVLDLIRGQTVTEARRVLRFSSRKGAKLALKVLDSAVANAETTGVGGEDGWVVAEARADKGPLFRKRRDPKARGSWGMITTPSTHLMIVVRQPSLSGEDSREGSTASQDEESKRASGSKIRRVGRKGKKNAA
jgi:large subunit ribosomal protein L22